MNAPNSSINNTDDPLASRSKTDTDSALWLARALDGLTAEEEAEFQAWLARDPAHGSKFNLLLGTVKNLTQLPEDQISNLKNKGLPKSGEKCKPKPRQFKPSVGWLDRLIPLATFASAAVFFVSLCWVGWNYWHQPTFSQSYVTARGQQVTANLPDGSKVVLDTSTRIEVTMYRNRREVRLLHGQALFDVERDRWSTFEVLAGPMQVLVLGTSFSVRYTPDSANVKGVNVAVEEGRVQVARISAPETAVEIAAGETVAASADGIIAPATRTLPSLAMAWRTGRVALNDTPLGEAVQEFERYVDTGLVITDPRVAALRLNGSFSLLQTDAFKRALPIALPVRLQPRSDGQLEVVLAK